MKSKDIDKYQQEMSEYSRWLEHSPIKLNDISSILAITINYISRGFEIKQVASFVAKYSDEYPLVAIELLNQLYNAAKEPWLRPDLKDEETILRNALDYGQREAKSKAILIINQLGEKGDFRWRSLLE